MIHYDRDQKDHVSKLRLNLVDNAYFGSRLKASDPPPALPTSAPLSNKRLRKAFVLAADYIRKLVAPVSVQAHGDVLSRWTTFIEKNAEVILLLVPTGANAYRMFETLNDRGLRTTQADLVKNFLFSCAGDQRCTEAQHSWSRMTGTLSVVQDEDEEKEDVTVGFLRTALMVIHGFLRKNQVFEVVQHLARGPETAMSLLKNLESLSAIYVATFMQDHEKWDTFQDSMRRAIETINDFGIKPFRPLLVSAAAHMTPGESTKVFGFCVSLGVRLLIASSTRSGSIEESVAKVAKKLFDKELKTASGVKKALVGITPTNEEFSQAFAGASVSKASLARYYLRAMELQHQKESGEPEKSSTDPWYVPNSDKEQMTLEHVLPSMTALC